jgi:hypothetical protein
MNLDSFYQKQKQRLFNPDHIIYQSKYFILRASQHPFVSREEGGHIIIYPKDLKIKNRSDLSPQQAKDFIRLSIIAGLAFKAIMNQQNIPVIKINYEDLSNWAYKRNEPPVFHLHLFGRAQNAKKQIFPEAVQLPARESGFYNSFQPLNKTDIKLLNKEIQNLYNSEDYSDNKWL